MTGLAADPLDPALVRVRDGRTILGAGFLVAPDVIATCAHVVGDAERATVDLPLLGVQDLVAEVVERDAALDVAILRLDDPPPGALPVPARISGDVRDHRFRTFGFPRDMPDGVWATGRLVGAQAAGRIQMVVDDHWRIEPGFSGAPVWDEQTGDVVGMVVTTSARNASTAHLVPTTALGDAWTSPVRNPYRGLRPFTEADAELFHGRERDVDRLAELVARQRVVAIAGPSGSGKSSLVKAGLLPRLADAEVVEIGPDQEIPAEIGPLLVLDQFEEAVIADPAAARQRLARIVELGHRAVLTLRSRSVDELITKDTAAELTRAVWFLEPMSREQLAAAIERPAAVVGGLAFEAGLVRRILDDTAAETGALPLVSLVLQELCEHRRGGWLTHADYESLGRVPGALSAAADAALTELDRTRARGLLTLLTRPDGEGGHARRSAQLGDLEGPLRDTAHRLAAKRLVVIEDERVNLTHQALIDHWPTLRDWLTEDADFLSWRAKLTDLHASGGVLRDAPLAEAESWLAQRPDDVPEAQRQFIRRSTAAQSRDRRRWRTITAVVSVLALIAAALAVVTARSNAQLDQRLREADASTLAEESSAAAKGNSSAALQLALAAWKTDPDNPAAIGALLQQRLYLRGVDRVLPPQLTGILDSYGDFQVSADGRTAMVVPSSQNDAVRVIRDPAGPRPLAEPLMVKRKSEFVLSPDGTALVEVEETGAVTLWDLTGRAAPAVLAESGVQSASFSRDGRWLLGIPEDAAPATLWNVPDRQRFPTGYQRVNGATEVVFPLPGGDRIVSEESRAAPTGKNRETWTVVRDAATGAEISARSGWSLLDSGVSAYRCDNGLYSVTDTATGRELTQGAADDCSKTDQTARYLLLRGNTTDDAVFKAIDATGKHSTLTDPAQTWFSGPDSSGFATSIARGPRGALVALSPREGSIHISELRTTSQPRHQPNSVMATSPDGDRLVASDEVLQAHVLDRERRLIGRLDLPSYQSEGSFAFDTTGTQLISMLPGKMRVQNAADLALLREIPVPAPPGFDEADHNHPPSIASVSRDEVLIEHRGLLTGFDPGTGRITRPPLDVLPDRRQNMDWSAVNVVGRPGHPDEVLVRDSDSLTTWNIRTRTPRPAIPIDSGAAGSRPATDPTGEHAAVTAENNVLIIDLDENLAVDTIPVDAFKTFGFLGDYLLLDGASRLQVLDWQWRRVITEFESSLGGDEPSVEGGRLFMGHLGGPSDSIPGDPSAWFDDLCRIGDRDYTDAERALVRDELTEERPCEG